VCPFEDNTAILEFFCYAMPAIVHPEIACLNQNNVIPVNFFRALHTFTYPPFRAGLVYDSWLCPICWKSNHKYFNFSVAQAACFNQKYSRKT